MKLLSALLVMSLTLASHDVLAKRIGGGSSIGKQSDNVAQRAATPPANAPSNTAGPQGAASVAKSPAAASAAVPAKKPWGTMLGGLAAGLGLAWLASSLGLGEAFGQILMAILLGVVVLAAIAFFMRARRGSPNQGGAGGLAFQGVGADKAVTPRDYSPQNVGNDASARPWERNTINFDAHRLAESSQSAGSASLVGSALSGSPGWGVPSNFDVSGFLQASKTNFISLQAAWDRSDIASLRAMMTDEMLAQIKAQLLDRERQAPGVANITEVVFLEARLLGIEDADGEHVASVEFSGMLREDPSAGPSPFREAWNITRSKSGTGGWLVAGVQSLQ